MPQFNSLARPILLSISAVSGDSYQDVDETDLRVELANRGLEPSRPALVNTMRALHEGSYIDCTFTGGEIVLIRLRHRGRQEVEGWPTTPGALSAADIEALVHVLEAPGQDVELSEEQRTRARAVAGAMRDLGVSVAAELVGAWLKHMGIG